MDELKKKDLGGGQGWGAGIGKAAMFGGLEKSDPAKRTRQKRQGGAIVNFAPDCETV